MAADIRATSNQAPPLVDHNTVTSDVALVEAVTRHASAATVEDLAPLGAEAGTAAYVMEMGQPWPGSVCDQAKKPAARRTCACCAPAACCSHGAACSP